jgi:protein-tyrosine phosphatase
MKYSHSLLIFLFPFAGFAQDEHLSTESVWATRDSTGTYQLQSTGKPKWQLFAGESPNAINWSAAIGTLKKQPVTYPANPDKRLYFAAVHKKDTLLFSERRIYMAGTPNFRDLGGLKTQDGRTVKWGVLFRSGDLGQLTNQDLAFVSLLNVKDVVDFRSTSEINQSPDKYPSEYAMHRIEAPIGQANGNGMAKMMQVVMNPAATGSSVEQVFTDFYGIMALGTKDYQPLFDELLQNAPTDGLLFHCTAGKDRTGLASALILSALGVPESTIIEEYYLSNRYTQKMLSKNPMMKQMKPEIASVLAGVKPEYIQKSLATIKEKYGSVNQMLEQELGLTESKRQELIRLYTY